MDFHMLLYQRVLSCFSQTGWSLGTKELTEFLPSHWVSHPGKLYHRHKSYQTTLHTITWWINTILYNYQTFTSLMSLPHVGWCCLVLIAFPKPYGVYSFKHLQTDRQESTLQKSSHEVISSPYTESPPIHTNRNRFCNSVFFVGLQLRFQLW